MNARRTQYFLAAVLGSTSSCASLDAFVFGGQQVDEYVFAYAPETPLAQQVPENLRELVRVSTEDNLTLSALWLKQPDAQYASAPVVLFHHGQTHNLQRHFAEASALWALGANVLAYDYRGYGTSDSAAQSEESFYADARAALQWLRDRGTTIAQEKVFHYGMSLGGAMAVQTAYHLAGVRGVILESTFTSLGALVADGSALVPRSFVVSARFDNRAKIRRVAQRVPLGVLLLHGTGDTYVQPRYSTELDAEIAGTADPLNVRDEAGKHQLELFDNVGHGVVWREGDTLFAGRWSSVVRTFLFR